MKKLITLTAMLLLLGCATPPKAKIMDQAEFSKLVREASISIKMAKSVGGEWSHSKKILDEAKLVAKTGDLKSAEKLANQAKAQGELGYQQAINQSNAGPWLF